MKKALLLLLLIVLPFATYAQGMKFGWFSYSDVFKTMPDYAVAQSNIAALREKYDAETKRVEDEFNAKYEEFLEGQSSFAPIIRQKRQAELQEIMSKNLAFKAEAQRLLKQAERDAYAPLREKISTALQRVGAERGLAFILNTDHDACPFIDPNVGEDVTGLLKELLR